MEAAIREAKVNFEKFIEAFWDPTERQKSFLVKVVLGIPNGCVPGDGVVAGSLARAHSPN